MTFERGMRVYFDGSEGRVEGTIIRVNRKTISIDPGTGDGYYRVPHGQVRVVGDSVAEPRLPQLLVVGQELYGPSAGSGTAT